MSAANLRQGRCAVRRALVRARGVDHVGHRRVECLARRGVDAHAFDPATQSLGELETAKFDRVFIALHGRGGEDGTIQGVLETLRIPYTGSGVQASAIAIDKEITKRIWETQKLPTPRYRVIDSEERAHLNEVADELRLTADRQAAERRARRSASRACGGYSGDGSRRSNWRASTTTSCWPKSSSTARS